MLGTAEQNAKLDEVRLAMERVRSGESDFEQIALPSGQTVTIHKDDSTPIGIRIRTPVVPRIRRKALRVDLRRRRMLRRGGVAAGRTRVGESPPAETGQGGVEAIERIETPAEHPGFAGESGQEGLVFRVRSFPPSEDRPQNYPEDLPFLPNLSVSVSVGRSKDGAGRAMNAAWMKPADPRSALEEIRGQLRAGGWEEGEASQASTFMGQTRTWTFQKGRGQRAVVLMDFGKVSQIMLFERQKS
jgi:hypothetical protein